MHPARTAKMVPVTIAAFVKIALKIARLLPAVSKACKATRDRMTEGRRRVTIALEHSPTFQIEIHCHQPRM